MMLTYTPQQILAFIAAFYPKRKFVAVPYAYTLTFLAFAQNAVASQNLSIQANADFCLLRMKYHAQIGAAQTVSNKTVAYARLMVVDNGSGENFFSAPVDLESIAYNDAQQAGVLPLPRIIGGRTSLAVTLTGYQPTAETYTSINLLFEGINIKVTQ